MPAVTYSVDKMSIRYDAETIDELVTLVAAFDISEPTMNDGWISHYAQDGQPVPDGVKVETLFDDGSGSVGDVENWNWEDPALVAYRVVK